MFWCILRFMLFVSILPCFNTAQVCVSNTNIPCQTTLQRILLMYCEGVKIITWQVRLTTTRLKYEIGSKVNKRDNSIISMQPIIFGKHHLR